MTVSDLAEYLKVSDSTIYRLLRSGHIPFSLKRDNGFYFHRHEIDRWIAERQAKNWTKRKRASAESTSPARTPAFEFV